MFPVTVTISNNAQLQAVLAALSFVQPAEQTSVSSKSDSPKEKATTAKKQETPVTTQPIAEAVVADAQSDKADNSEQSEKAEDESPATYEDASKAIIALSKAKGRDAAVAVLEKFQAANLKAVKPEDYAAVIVAANKALEG
ncbi:MAG: hypothetical protein U1D69_07665 [Polynucleobacter sp.]|nr:hypothetical protein [Polynucleobacter sp.]